MKTELLVQMDGMSSLTTDTVVDKTGAEKDEPPQVSIAPLLCAFSIQCNASHSGAACAPLHCALSCTCRALRPTPLFLPTLLPLHPPPSHFASNVCAQVVVLAASNLPWALDEAFRRRLEKRICTFEWDLPESRGSLVSGQGWG